MQTYSTYELDGKPILGVGVLQLVFKTSNLAPQVGHGGDMESSWHWRIFWILCLL
jgi:hypothetical protein